MKRRTAQFIWGAGALVASIGGHAARAQDVSASPDAGTNFDRQRTVAVGDRVQPGYEQIGARVGSFAVLPRIEVAALADDNVLARGDDRKGDVALVTAPSVRVLSQWSRNQLALSASGDLARMSRLKSEDREGFALRGEGRIDAGSRFRVYAYTGLRRDVERRSDPGALRNSVRPATYTTVSGGGRATWQGDRLRVSAEAGASRIRYEDVTTSSGQVIDARALDRRQIQLGIRADYALTPDLAFLVSARVTKLSYPATASGDPSDRTSRKTELLAGISFEFTDLLRGEVAVGHIDQHYRNPGLTDFGGFGGRAQIEYFPTQLTTVRLDTSRTLHEAGNPLAPSYRRTHIGAQVDHELYRYLVLSASADFEDDRFQAPDRIERRVHLGLSGRYLINRNWSLVARYDHLRVTTAPRDLGRRLTENAAIVGVLFTL